jgi:hypothetical protein
MAAQAIQYTTSHGGARILAEIDRELTNVGAAY